MKYLRIFVSLLLSLIMLSSFALSLNATTTMREVAPDINSSFATPTLDGTINTDEGWTRGVNLDKRNMSENDSFSGTPSSVPVMTVFTAHDDNNFYVAAEIKDETFCYTDSLTEYNPSSKTVLGFDGEIFAFTIDPLGLFNEKEFNSNDDYLPTYSVGIYENGTAKVYSCHYDNAVITEGADVAAKRTSYGWSLEMSVSFDLIISNCLKSLDVLVPGLITKVNLRQEIIDECIARDIKPPYQLIDGVTPANVEAYANEAGNFIRQNLTREKFLSPENESKVLFIYEDKEFDPDSDQNRAVQRYSTTPFRLKDGMPGYTTKGISIAAVGETIKFGNDSFTIPLKDIRGKWFEEAVGELYYRSYISGTSETTYSPNNNMTRADFITILGRLNRTDTYNYGSAYFTDVPFDAYYFKYVDWAYKNRVVSGIGNRMFGPKKNITRQEIAVILYNYSASLGLDISYDKNALDGYKGTENIASWAKVAVTWAVDKSIISGDSDKNINPTNNATRAEVAQMLYKFSTNILNIM